MVRDSMLKLPLGAAYLAVPSPPAVPEKLPGVVVIHEIFGLVDYVKEIARNLADGGYVALAVDLFGGRTTTTLEEGRKIREELKNERIIQMINDGIKYLRSPNPARKVGIVGFCMGGGISLLAATAIAELSAAVVFYGRIQDTGAVRTIQCPVLGVFGELDEAITKWAETELKPTMAKYGKLFEMRVYEGAQHAFHNHTRPERYHAAAARDAWQLTLRFFERSLKR